jgi:hypothetical protein
MKLPHCPWKQAWHDDQVSEKFFQELAKLEKSQVRELDSSARWMEQLVVELGQLAQNMIQLEQADPHAPQVTMAFERSVKLAALATHLAGALHLARTQAVKPGDTWDTARPHSMAQAVEAAAHQTQGGALPSAEHTHLAGNAPMRRTIHSLADRGVSISEIEVITGHPKHVIEAILAER